MNSISRMGVDEASSYSAATKRAENAEKEANKRVQAAETHIHQTELEEENKLAYLREDFLKQGDAEAAHQDALIEAQRLKGYENLRNLQLNQAKELNRVRQEGESRLSKMRNYYRDTLYSIEQKGARDLRDLKVNSEQNLEYSRKVGDENMNALSEEHVQNTLALTRQYEDKVNQLKTEQNNELERKQTASRAASELAEGKFQTEFERLNKSHKDQLRNLEGNANRQIEAIRQDTADKLTTYRTRQNDPFYKMIDLDAVLKEGDENFTLTLNVPEYEQKSFSASIKGDNLVVMGQRRNEEILKTDDGVSQGTASFQSYSLSIPLSWPVDPSRLTKELNGDTVTIRVPKRNRYASHEKPKAAPKPVNETVQFPSGIQEFFAEKQGNSGSKFITTKKTPGSGTIS